VVLEDKMYLDIIFLDNMTTPTNDLTMTLKEGTDALLHIENTENDEDAGEEVVRAFTAEDFHQAIQAQKGNKRMLAISKQG